MLPGVAAAFLIAVPATERPASAQPTAGDATAARRLAVEVHRRATLLSRRVQSQLSDARFAGDQARTRCLDGQLSQVNSTLRQIEHQVDVLEVAFSSADPAARQRVAATLRVLDERLNELDRDAGTCVGLRPGARVRRQRSDRTEVTVTVDPRTPRRP
jgi:hypothetical protein